MILFSQFYSYMLPVCRAPFTDVDRYIKYCTFHTTHNLALGEWWTLEMQATHHSVTAHALVVLHKYDWFANQWDGNLLVEISL